MRYYERKVIYSVLFLVLGVIFMISGLILIMMGGDYTTGLTYVVVALIIIFNAYLYRRPYLGLGEGKLIINNGILKKEIVLTNIASMNETNKKLKINYIQGSTNILLSTLKDNDKIQFLNDLHSQLGY